MASKFELYDAHGRSLANRPVLINLFEQYSEWWKGFDLRDESRKPNDDEKQKMIMYPIISNIIEVKYLPLLSCHFNVDGDEKQVDYVKFWLERHYRRCMKLMLQRAIIYGMAVGERIVETVYIDNKPYWMHVGSFVPDPQSIELKFSKEKPEIKGFDYATMHVDRYTDSGDWMIPGMIYWNYNGDEVSLPYGDSILNKLYWAWQLVMKTWTNILVYQRLHSPFLKYFYVPEEYGNEDNAASKAASREAAKADIASIKSTQGIGLELVRDKDQNWAKGPDLEVVAPPDREPQFNETIRVLNTLMYIAVSFPERLIEQFKDTGAKAQSETQKDFYTQYSIGSEIEMHQHFLNTWFLDPMLEVNFGKIDCQVDATVSDTQKEMYAELVGKLIGSQWAGPELLGIIDLRQLIEKLDMPVAEFEKGPTVETAERKAMLQGIEFASTKREEKKRLEAWAQKVVDVMNKQVTKIKDDVYGLLKKRLEEQHGKMTLRIARLFSNGAPKRIDLQKAIQIPNNVYAGLRDYILEAWDSGQRWHCEYAKIRSMKDPSPQVREQLRTLEDIFTGSELLMGEGEILERRLYNTLANVRPEDALGQLNLEFDTYIKQTLPIRVQNVVHRANHYGTRDFARHLQITRAEEKRG